MSDRKNAPERILMRPKGGAGSVLGGWADPFVVRGDRKPDDAEYVLAATADAQREELERLMAEVNSCRLLMVEARRKMSDAYHSGFLPDKQAEDLWSTVDAIDAITPTNPAQEGDDA